jgi:pyruvate dehydrogenase E2 component (dihydrolipoamide acetyltransferase)
MPRLLRMPEVAAGAAEAVLAEWLVAEQAEFAAADTLATVETDKAMVDVEADDAGVLLSTLVAPGAHVEVGAPIAVLGQPGEAVPDIGAVLADLGVAATAAPTTPATPAEPAEPETPAATLAPSVAPAPSAASPAAAGQSAAPPAAAPAGPGGNGRVFASPLARKIARQSGVAVETITGTGPGGRILRRDVDAAIAARPAAPPAAAPPAPAPPAPAPPAAAQPTAAPAAGTAARDGGDIPHSRPRRAIAARLTESQQTVPHFYLRATVRADRLVALRAEINTGLADGARVSVNDLVVKAVAAAHQRVPEMNVIWTPDAVRTFATVDVAVAVATDRGLVTPVLRDVTGQTITQVAAHTRDLATRARDGQLRQHELDGGTISVSNLGMYGVEEFAAIINPPHAAILAVGAVRDEPVVEDGAVVPGKVMTVTLSVDHRPVDGVIAARWLAALRDLLENPLRVLI